MKKCFYLFCFTLLISCSSKQDQPIILDQINTLQSVGHNFDYYIDEHNLLTGQQLSKFDFDELTFLKANSDVINRSNHLVVLKIPFENQNYPPLEDQALIFELGFPFIKDKMVLLKKRDKAQLYVVPELASSILYDKRHFNYKVEETRSNIEAIYFVLDSYSLPIFANVFIWDAAYYKSSGHVIMKYGFLYGLYGVSVCILFILAFVYKTKLNSAIGFFTAANLVLFLLDGGWIRAIFSDYTFTHIGIEYFTYVARYLVAIAGIHICTTIYSTYNFGKSYIVWGKRLRVLILGLGLIHLVLAFFFTNSPLIFIVNHLIFIGIFSVIAYSVLALTNIFIKTKERFYFWLILIPGVHIFGIILLVLRALNVLKRPLHHYLSSASLESFPIINYHPVLLDIGMLVEVAGITLLVFLAMQESLFLHNKVKNKYWEAKASISKQLMEVEQNEKQYFRNIVEDRIINNLTSLQSNIEQLGIGIGDEQLEDLFSKLMDGLDEIDHDYGTANVDFATKIESFVSTLRANYTAIDFQIKQSNLINQLSVIKKDNIFRIILEAINNAIKHANCDRVVIAFAEDEKSVSISIKDNGKGFSYKNLNKIGNGLVNFENRVNAIEGELKIISKRSFGTTISIKVDKEL